MEKYALLQYVVFLFKFLLITSLSFSCNQTQKRWFHPITCTKHELRDENMTCKQFKSKVLQREETLSQVLDYLNQTQTMEKTENKNNKKLCYRDFQTTVMIMVSFVLS